MCECGNDLSDYWDAFTRGMCIRCYMEWLRGRPHP
jgi:hypothetical protein